MALISDYEYENYHDYVITLLDKDNLPDKDKP